MIILKPEQNTDVTEYKVSLSLHQASDEKLCRRAFSGSRGCTHETTRNLEIVYAAVHGKRHILNLWKIYHEALENRHLLK